MMFLFLLLAIALALIAATVLIRNARVNYGSIEAGNIPVVPPSLFLGSEVNLHKEIQHLEDVKRGRKYGPIWGTYVGKYPQVHITDPELIRCIFVKDFEYFYNRQEVDFGTPIINEVQDYLQDDKWKTLRHDFGPVFTPLKLQGMSSVIERSAAEFVQRLKSEAVNGRVKFDCKTRISTWLTDMFAQTFFSIRMENSEDPENPFAKSFREINGENVDFTWLYTLSLSFPFLTRFASIFHHEPAQLVATKIKQIFQDRRNTQDTGPKNPNDIVDLFNELISKAKTDEEYKRLGITEDTIVCQAVTFFLAGDDLTSTNFAYLLLELAKHPEIQDKLASECAAMLDKFDGRISNESVRDGEIPYTLAVLKESLRLAPPLLRPERICTKDWKYEPLGISIKKGTIVMIAAWAANRNPDIYPDPDRFLPERFLPENKGNLNPYAFTTFGHGPKNCTAIRMVYQIMKLLLLNLVKEFRVEARGDTELRYKPGCTLLVGLDSPLLLDLVLR